MYHARHRHSLVNMRGWALPRPCLHLLILVILCALRCHVSAASDANDPLLLLPSYPKPMPVVVPALNGLRELVPGSGVEFEIGKRVALAGSLIIDQGPVDGLEVFACLQQGKTHESLVRLTATTGQVVTAAFKAALGVIDGVTSPESSGLPARGTPMRVLMQWQSLDKPGTWLAVDASCLVRDRVSDRPYPPLPYMYTGSRFVSVEETGNDGHPIKRERFMLDITKSIMVNFDEPDALLAAPFPGANYDKRFEANSSITPPAGTPVKLIFEKAELPLMLSMSDDGQLHVKAGSEALSDAQIGDLLTLVYGADAKPALRAVAVSVAPAVERDKDVAARTRLLAIAIAVKAWVVPVFVISF